MWWMLALSVHAFDVEIPREQDQIRPRCESTFPSALADKQAYEARVRVDCLHGLPRREMKELEDAFIENCVSTTNARVRKLEGPGRVTIDDALVTTMFNYDYTPIFRKACMDRELSRFYRENSRETAPAATLSPRISDVYR